MPLHFFASVCLSPLRLLAAMLLVLVAMQATAQEDAFDPSVAGEELDALQLLLENEDIIEVELKRIRERALEIKSDAASCASQLQPQVDELRTERDLVGDISDDVDVEIWQSRVEIGIEYARAEASLKNCELVASRANRLAEAIEARLKELSTALLGRRDDNILSVLIQVPQELARWPGQARDKLQPELKENVLPLVATWVVVLGTLFGVGVGVYLRRQFRKGPVALGDTIIRPTVAEYFLKPMVERLPLDLGALAALLSMATVFIPPLADIVAARVAAALLIYGIAGFLIDWSVGPLSPVSRIEGLLLDHAQSLRRRSRYLVLVLLTTVVVLGPSWLGEDATNEFQLARLLAILAVATALLAFLGFFARFREFSGRFRIVRVAAFLAVIAGLVAELVGYHNFASFLLRGLTLTSLAAFGLWFLLWQAETFTEWLDASKLQTAGVLRTVLGVPGDSRRPGLGLYRLIVDTALWIGFLVVIVDVWDTSGTMLNELYVQATEGIAVGNITIVPADIIMAVLVFAGIIVVTGWAKGWIDRRWLKHITRDRGSRDAVTTVVGYIGFIIAVIVALSIAGINVTGITVVAGALSVGIGFGMQAIANNFVSGIILLFERPIKAGDFVTVGDVEGFVKRISIRSTEIETLDNQDMLVPNSELISGRVTNWVLHNPYGRLRLKVGVAYGSDIVKVKEILEEVAHEHPEVITDGRATGPKALFMEFGDSALEFELRVRILRIPRRFDVTSELNFAIDKKFREFGIQIPFPQRDLHVKYWPDGQVPGK